MDMKLTPDDLKVPAPKFYKGPFDMTQDERFKVLKLLDARPFAFDEKLPPEIHLDQSEAIRVIQAFERGRQGKLRAKHMLDLKKKAIEAARSEESKDEKGMTNRAAFIIQRL